ncbi:hypothetical protein IPH25_02200 [bacterium]|nr:MAG: hypothetical protein IPH25_02200 [bacterium]QQR63201.1 MAG: hypothetical protein IPH67_01870 [bacterium]
MKRAFIFYYLFLILIFSTFHDTSAEDCNQEPIKINTVQQNETQKEQNFFLNTIIRELNSDNLNSTHTLAYTSQLLEQCAINKKDRSEMKDVLKLFHNRCKRVEYINPESLSTFLNSLPKYLSSYMYTGQSDQSLITFYDETMFDQFNKRMNNLLLNSFSKKFDQFKLSPELFLSNIAKQIAQHAQTEVEIEQLRQTTLRFLETNIGKLIWSPKNAEKTWQSLTKLSKELTTLLEKNIILEVDDLNDLLWSLTNRYCYFLELAGAMMPEDFYISSLEKLKENSMIISRVEEQNEYITSKTDYLKNALEKGLEKSKMNQDTKIL